MGFPLSESEVDEANDIIDQVNTVLDEHDIPDDYGEYEMVDHIEFDNLDSLGRVRVQLQPVMKPTTFPSSVPLGETVAFKSDQKDRLRGLVFDE